MTKLLALAILALFMTGCATGARYDKLEVKDKELVYVKIPEHLTEPSKPKKPISKEEYLKLKPHEREQYLASYSESLLITIKECNIDKEKIRKLNSNEK